MRKHLICMMMVGLVACSERSVTDVVQASVQDVDCLGGDTIELPSGAVACTYRKPIVIETGFSCPAGAMNRFDFQSFTECDSRVELPFEDLDFLNYEDFVGLKIDNAPWDFSELPRELAPTQELDILWVIDNSGSMCQEQAQLRESFDAFSTSLASAGVDFHVGITTTQANDIYPLDPIAKTGHLQSTPQPVPGFDSTCQVKIDGNGVPDENDFSPVRSAISAAVACMTTPDPDAFDWTDDEIACAFRGPEGCAISGASCGGFDRCQPEHLFPDPQSYRSIPKVLRSADYTNPQGVLDVSALQADFACASFVGTRGYGIEEGLKTSVAAVSPELNAAGAPNEGFIRKDARFALFFVTDENDCSHDGSLDTQSVCAGDICEIVNHPDAVDSPLIAPDAMRTELIVNLGRTKNRLVDPREILVASFHGPSDRYSGAPDETCDVNSTWDGIMPKCATQLGVSFSGDRYDRFLRAFPLGNTFPYAPNATVAMEGWMCNGDLAPGLQSVGQFLATAVNR